MSKKIGYSKLFNAGRKLGRREVTFLLLVVVEQNNNKI